MTSRRPSRRASLPSRQPYHRRASRFAPDRTGTAPPGLDHFLRGARAALVTVETTRSPRFLGRSQCVRAPLSDPAGPLTPGQFRASDAACRSEDYVGSGWTTSRGSITRPARPLCTLRSRGHPRTTQHSVPAGGQPLPGRVSTCQICTGRFQTCAHPLLHVIPLPQASPGATPAED